MKPEPFPVAWEVLQTLAPNADAALYSSLGHPVSVSLAGFLVLQDPAPLSFLGVPPLFLLLPSPPAWALVGPADSPLQIQAQTQVPRAAFHSRLVQVSAERPGCQHRSLLRLS